MLGEIVAFAQQRRRRRRGARPSSGRSELWPQFSFRCGSGAVLRAVLLAGAALWADGRRADCRRDRPSAWAHRGRAARIRASAATRARAQCDGASDRDAGGAERRLPRAETNRARGFPTRAGARAHGARLFRRQEMTPRIAARRRGMKPPKAQTEAGARMPPRSILVMPEQGKKNDDRNRNSEQPQERASPETHDPPPLKNPAEQREGPIFVPERKPLDIRASRLKRRHAPAIGLSTRRNSSRRFSSPRRRP